MKTKENKDSSITIQPITYAKQKTLTSEKSYYNINFFMNPNELTFSNNYTKFIRSVEGLVRKSEEYTNYIDYIRNQIGLNYCMVMPNIDGDNAKIEMHHGPILTLYDYISIFIEYYIKVNKNFNSFKLAEAIIKAHYRNEIQVVMLSVSVHQLVHDNKIFIHPKQAFGDFNKFIKKYKLGLTDEMKNNINDYITLSEMYKSNDFGVIKTGDYMNYNVVTQNFGKKKEDAK